MFQFCPHAKMTLLSIYMPSDDLFQFRTLWRRGEVYMIERMGDTGEPCGVLTVKSNGSDVLPLNLRWTVWFLRKDLH